MKIESSKRYVSSEIYGIDHHDVIRKDFVSSYMWLLSARSGRDRMLKKSDGIGKHALLVEILLIVVLVYLRLLRILCLLRLLETVLLIHEIALLIRIPVCRIGIAADAHRQSRGD